MDKNLLKYQSPGPHDHHLTSMGLVVIGRYNFNRKVHDLSKISPENAETIKNDRFHCYECNTLKPAAVYRQFPVLHYCFIPLIPLCCIVDENDECIACADCGGPMNIPTFPKGKVY